MVTLTQVGRVYISWEKSKLAAGLPTGLVWLAGWKCPWQGKTGKTDREWNGWNGGGGGGGGHDGGGTVQYEGCLLYLTVPQNLRTSEPQCLSAWTEHS